MSQATTSHGRFYDDYPNEIGKFQKWDCPNDETIVYYRDYYATDDGGFPKLREEYKITTHAADGFDVKRSVELCEESNYPKAGVCKDLQSIETIGKGFDNAQLAFRFLKTRIEAASASDDMPKDVMRTKNPIHRHFRDLRLDNDD